MSYTKEINRKNPTCFLFVIDQSGSMDERMGDGSIKSEFVADVLNQTIAETIVRCTKADGVRDYFDIGVIGYGGDRVPIAAQQLSRRSAWTDTGQAFVHFRGKHGFLHSGPRRGA